MLPPQFNPRTLAHKAFTLFPSAIKRLYLDRHLSHLMQSSHASTLLRTASASATSLSHTVPPPKMPRKFRRHITLTSDRLRKTGPTAALLCLPIVGYAFCLVAFVAPRFLLCDVFWTEEEREVFRGDDFEAARRGRVEVQELVVGGGIPAGAGLDDLSGPALRALARSRALTALEPDLLPEAYLKAALRAEAGRILDEVECLRANGLKGKKEVEDAMGFFLVEDLEDVKRIVEGAGKGKGVEEEVMRIMECSFVRRRLELRENDEI